MLSLIDVRFCLAFSLVLAACHSEGPRLSPAAPPEVAAKCTPVSSLLSKNYERTRGIAIPLIGSVGDSVSYEGAVLTSEAAERIARADSMCRAWVFGTISDGDYTRFLLSTIVDSELPNAVSDTNLIPFDGILARLEQLEGSSSIPLVNNTELRALIERFARLSSPERDRENAEQFAGLANALDRNQADIASLRLEVYGRLQLLSSRIDQQNDQQYIMSISAHQSLTPQFPYRIFFATGSSELTKNAKDDLRRLLGSTEISTGLVVTGYTDPRGSPYYNNRLAIARARSVALFLAELGYSDVEFEGSTTAPDGVMEYDEMRSAELRLTE